MVFTNFIELMSVNNQILLIFEWFLFAMRK
mgnify:FL=1